jgi:hypothetical protein
MANGQEFLFRLQSSPPLSRSLGACWLLQFFLRLSFVGSSHILSRELWGIVSSMRVIAYVSCSMMTICQGGLRWREWSHEYLGDCPMLSFLVDLHEATLSDSRWSLRPLTNSVGQILDGLQIWANRLRMHMWWMVGWQCCMHAPTESRWNPPPGATFSYWVHGVGRVSICASSEKKRQLSTWQALLYILFALSSSITPRAFDWMDISSNFLCIYFTRPLSD